MDRKMKAEGDLFIIFLSAIFLSSFGRQFK